MTKLRLTKLVVAVMAVSALNACGMWRSVTEDKKIDYEQSKIGRPLEVPPDLSSRSIDDSLGIPGTTSGGAVTYSGYASGRKDGTASAAGRGTGVLPEPGNVRMERSGSQRWLVAKGDPEQMWPVVRDFWLKNGLLLEKENPQSGVMETDWAENRANIQSNMIQSFLAKHMGSLYSTGMRDKFRVRLERGAEPGTTEIYMSHRGMKEVLTRVGSGEASTTTMWESRPADPELEAEMLRLLMVHLGVDSQRAQTMVASAAPQAERAKLARDAQGNGVLQLSDSFDRAWRRVGLSLDRVGFTVEDRDRSKGVYYVRYSDPDATSGKKGFLSKLAFWSSGDEKRAAEYQVALAASGPGTDVSVRDKAGAPENTKTGERILGLLHEQLK